MTKVSQWVQDIVGDDHLVVGMKTTHPKTGKTVKITRGQFWGEYGVSNFWYWREVLPDGSLSDIEEHGYGWQPNNACA